MSKQRAGRNKTLTISDNERAKLKEMILFPDSHAQSFDVKQIINKTICADLLEIIDLLPEEFADLIILDPPYNLSRNFHGFKFNATDNESYKEYLKMWFPKIIKRLKPDGSLYLCGDWKNTAVLYEIMSEHLHIINRITWQREKGRGAKKNWKNGMEDIWFGVKDKTKYYFDLESVKERKKVIAPYRENGKPKDWEQTESGKFRLTCPSNFWSDITIPFWSMPENTDHPTQKSEKLIAKLILASSAPNAVILDPFLGSGTTSVVAKKLNRRYVGIELNEEYCLWAEKRLANEQNSIQGYVDGVFKERNQIK